MVYELEKISYYFSVKPNEFWNSTYREINIYIQMQISRKIDELRQNIIVYDASTDKLIMANAMSIKNPKIISLKKTFEKLFKKK